jgi:asparagine synthase (glutamine-hydrolysing)
VCGIAGIYTPGHAADRDVLGAMVDALHHRGPDGDGFHSDGDVALGMRRLAIVDVEHGDQPLRNEDGRIAVVFNGELYNHEELRAQLAPRHELRSGSDGEVIAHLYEEHGPAFVERLNGIFAIALWDGRDRSLLLARDQLGVKPLYVHDGGPRGLRFASELKALIEDPAVPRELDAAALDDHLTFRFTPAPRTLLAGVEKLEPGSWLRVGADGRVERTRYWSPRPELRTDLSFAAAADEFRERLRAAVRRQMMSDRPIGAMLSGGIDSAAIVALMAEAGGTVKSYTVGFTGGGDADETALARQTAELFGTEHHDLIVPAGDFRDDLRETVEFLEEPVGTTSALGFRQVSRLAAADVPVLLSGQGADEMLAGYWRYVGEWIAGHALRLPRPLRAPLSAASRRTKSQRLERGLRALRYPDTLERFMQIYALFTPEQKGALYPASLRDRIDGNDPSRHVSRRIEQAAGRDSLAQMMYVDTRLWLPDDLLLVGDKMSMAESVEMRVPFLDPDLVTFVESLPTSYKLRRGRRKAVHKEAMSPLLPREIVHRKERGFATPVDAWLRSDLYPWARELLLDGHGFSGRTFDTGYVGKLLDDHRDGRADHTRRLFALLSLELWSRRFLAA